LTDLLKHIQPFATGIVFLLLYLAEHVFPQRTGFNDLKHDAGNMGFGLINAAVVFAGGYYFQQFLSFLHQKHFGLFNNMELPFAIQLIMQVICIDVFMYWWHRLNHRWTFLWCFHKLHHEDEKMNSTTALRFHVGELSLSYVARLLVFPLLGISVSAVLLYGFLFFPVVMLHHSNIRIGKWTDHLFRKMIVTPRMHRIHHSRIQMETDSNYGSVFPWWDLVFHTYRKVPVKEIDFGLDKISQP
jgi:sterol desaturase/sphingolipid hydroxylase (fatty acid hydroxylase superfamily)